jgi:hypothetical protein
LRDVINEDGRGRAAKRYLPAPANLIIFDTNDRYRELIVRRGGAALMRSKSIPPWGEELSDEQIAGVVSFLQALKSVLRLLSSALREIYVKRGDCRCYGTLVLSLSW